MLEFVCIANWGSRLTRQRLYSDSRRGLIDLPSTLLGSFYHARLAGNRPSLLARSNCSRQPGRRAVNEAAKESRKLTMPESPFAALPFGVA